MTNLIKGQRVRITCDGRTVAGVVILASTNGKSLALSFEAILAGHVGMMPVLRDEDGVYRSLVGGVEVGIRPPAVPQRDRQSVPALAYHVEGGRP